MVSFLHCCVLTVNAGGILTFMFALLLCDFMLMHTWFNVVKHDWMAMQEPYRGILVFINLRSGPYLFKFFCIWLQLCLPLKFRKCFMNPETSFTSPVNFQFWVNIPLQRETGYIQLSLAPPSELIQNYPETLLLPTENSTVLTVY